MKKLTQILYIVAAIIILVAVCLFAAFILVPKMGVLSALILVASIIPFITALYASYLPSSKNKDKK